MVKSRQPDFFAEEPQSDLFGESETPTYRPDPARVRARLLRILSETRSATATSWEPGRLSLYRTIFPQLTLFLPEDEAAQLRLAFEGALEQLQPV